MGVKFAKAFGAHTVLFTTSEGKVADGKRLGADEVVISKDGAQMTAHAGSCDMILDTVSADHDVNAYLSLLKLDATLVMVGAPPNPQAVSVFNLLMPRRSLAGSLIGGIAENFGASFRLTDSKYFVIESDEYDTAYFDKGPKMWHYLPDPALVNNLEFEHAHIHDVHGPEWLAWTPLLVLILVLGIYPGLLFQVTDGAVQTVTAAFAEVAGS
jgi:hypothetical protein